MGNIKHDIRKLTVKDDNSPIVSARNDSLPSTDDINHVVSRHVECVVLLSRVAK